VKRVDQLQQTMAGPSGMVAFFDIECCFKVVFFSVSFLFLTPSIPSLVTFLLFLVLWSLIQISLICSLVHLSLPLFTFTFLVTLQLFIVLLHYSINKSHLPIMFRYFLAT
jgi:hypothetical protein